MRSNWLVGALLFSFATVAFARETLKGLYEVHKIEKVESTDKKGETFYRILFTGAQPATGRMLKPLVLETYHVHVALKEGLKLQLLAEVDAPAATGKDGIIVDQVLVYIKRANGEVPVWMVARHSKKIRLEGASYLKMHDPQSDFLIF